MVGGRFNGTLEKLGLDARLCPAFRRPRAGQRPHAHARAGDGSHRPGARVRGQGDQSRNGRWRGSARGTVTIKGRARRLHLRGPVPGAYENYGSGEADYRLARKGDDLIFEYLNLKTEKGAAISARGKVTLPTPQSELAMDVTAHARGIDTQAHQPAVAPGPHPPGERRDPGQAHRFHLPRPGFRLLREPRHRVWSTTSVVRKGDDFTFDTVKLRTDSGGHPERPRPGQPRQGRAPRRAADWNRLSWPLQGGAPVVVSQSGEGHVTAPSPTTSSTWTPSSPDRASRRGTGCSPAAATRRGWTSARCAATCCAGGSPRRAPSPGSRGRLESEAQRQRYRSRRQVPGLAGPHHFRRRQRRHRCAATAPTAGWTSTSSAAICGATRSPARVHLELAGDRYRLPGLDLRSGTARVTAAGAFTKTAGDLDWRLAAPNLAEALPDAGGAVTAQGHLAGPVEDAADPRPGARPVDRLSDLQRRDRDPQRRRRPRRQRPARDQPQGRQRRAQRPEVRHRHPQQPGDAAGPPDRPRRAGGDGTLDLALAGGLQGTTAWSGEIRRLDLATSRPATGGSPVRPG